MNRYDLAIFDFDGTLADSAAWFRSNINQVAQRYGFRQVTEEELERLRGQPSAAIIRYLGVPAWKIPFIASHMRKLLGRETHRIVLFDGVDALLSSLVQRGVALAIATSNSKDGRPHGSRRRARGCGMPGRPKIAAPHHEAERGRECIKLIAPLFAGDPECLHNRSPMGEIAIEPRLEGSA